MPRPSVDPVWPAAARRPERGDPRASLRGRDLLSIADLGRVEIEAVLDRAVDLKAEFRAVRRHRLSPLAGRTLAMLFEKPSLRTRVTFEAGMSQLGGHAIHL